MLSPKSKQIVLLLVAQAIFLPICSRDMHYEQLPSIMYDNPSVADNYPKRVIKEFKITGPGSYSGPVWAWVHQGRQTGWFFEDSHDWLVWATGMTAIVGARLGHTFEQMRHYMHTFHTRHGNEWINADWASAKELQAMIRAYQGGGDQNLKYFDRLVAEIFRDVIPCLQASRRYYDQKPKDKMTNLSKIGYLKDKKINLGVQADSVSIFDKLRIAFTTAPSNRNWSPLGAFKDNDVFLWTGSGQPKNLKKSENYFRHGLKMMNGYMGWDQQAHVPNSPNANPLNPFDPMDSWGYLSGPPLPEAYSKVVSSAAGHFFVVGSDAQPYLYDDATGITHGYGLKYRDGCFDLSASETKMAMLFRKDVIILGNKPDMASLRSYNRGLSPARGWDAIPETPNSWGFSFSTIHLHKTYDGAHVQPWKWIEKDWMRRPPQPPLYSLEPFVTLPGREDIRLQFQADSICLGFDNSLWVVSGGRLHKRDSSGGFPQVTGIKDVYKLAVGKNGKALALKNDGSLFASSYESSTAAGDMVWTDVGLKVKDCSVGADNNVALLDGTDGSVYVLSFSDLEGQKQVLGLETGSSVQIESNTSEWIKVLPSGDLTLTASQGESTIFTVEKHSGSNVLALKASNGKYLAASTGDSGAKKGTPVKAALDTVEDPASDDSINVSLPGHWSLEKAGDRFYIKERVSGRFIGKIRTTKNLGLADDKSLSFKLTTDVKVVKVDASGEKVVAAVEVGAKEDFDLLVKSIQSATQTLVEVDGKDVNLEEVESKLILIAYACGVTVNDPKSFAPASSPDQKAVSVAVADEFFGKATVPSALTGLSRAQKIIKLLDDTTKDAKNKDTILLNSGLTSLVGKTLVAIQLAAGFLKDKDLARSAKKITQRFGQTRLATGYPDRIAAVKEKFTAIKNTQTAEEFYRTLEGIVKDRLDGDSATLESLARWIVQTSQQSDQISSVKHLKAARVFDKLKALATKVSEPVTLEEAIDRLERYVSEGGIVVASQQETFSNILSKLTVGKLPAASLKDAPGSGYSSQVGPIWRLTLSKARLGRLIQAATKFRDLNFSGVAASGATGSNISAKIDFLKSAKMTDFKGGFLAKINNLLVAIPDNIDSKGLWSRDSSDPVKARSLDAVDPSKYYTLKQFWTDFSAWQEWSPDLKNPAYKYPLMRFCNQVIDSIEEHFASDPDYQKIKGEAKSMLSKIKRG